LAAVFRLNLLKLQSVKIGTTLAASTDIQRSPGRSTSKVGIPATRESPRRFKIGDQVTFVGAGGFSPKQEGVIEIIEGSLEQMYRYHIQFSNGTWGRCLGCELMLASPEAFQPNQAE
jgi:hypothetical protein